ncbi:MAG: tetratricopeptide repeat protein [Deltaproteobacteria bacterium]|nr:tetratricopeptide repeat protein [Deltaproteobacteria bacterium]
MIRHLPLLALPLLLLASAPADAARDAKEPPPAEAEAGPTPEERQAAFAAYEANFQSGQKARAADALVGLLADPVQAAFHAEAYAKLGNLLVDLDLPYGALLAYARALYADPDCLVTEGVIEKAFTLADQVGDTAVLEPVFGKNVGGRVDRPTRARMGYLAARENYRQGNLTLALSLLKLVIPESPVYPDALMLEGVILNRQDRPQDALKPLLAAGQAAQKAQRDSRFLNTIWMNLGRSYYAADNFPRAIEQYARVTRDSEFWLQAQFERAWAHFRLEDMNGAIALLHNHVSPFFESWYFPEGELLRVYALFLLCKFPEASEAIDTFKETYAPAWQTMRDAMAGMSSDKAYEFVKEYLATGNAGPLPEMVLRSYRNEARFAAAVNAASHADDEMERLRNVAANPFAAQVSRWVAGRRQDIVQVEGERILSTLQRRTEELGGMLTSAEMSKLDMLQMETRLYEMASQTGKVPDADRQVRRGERVRKGFVWWPWEGEYWQDELGYYRVNALAECPAGLRAAATGE